MADTDVGSLVVRIEADLKNFENGIKNLHEKVDGFGSKLKEVGKIIAEAFVVEKVAEFFKSTIEEAGKSQETLTQLNAVLKSTGEKAGITSESAIELAESFSKITKFSKDTVLGAENMLLTFTNIGKDIFPQATTAVLNMSTALGQDLKSSSIQLGKALQDPVAGVTALQRVGVKLTEAQKEQVKSFVAVGDTVSAQKVILKELDTEFGNSAVMAGQTFPGKLAILNNKFDELKIKIGDKLIPVLADIADWFSAKMPSAMESVEKAFDKINSTIKFVSDNANILIPIIAGLTSVIVGQLIIDKLVSLYGIWEKATKTITTAQWLWNLAMDANPIGEIALLIGLLVGAGILLYEHWDVVKAKALELWASIKQTFSNVETFFLNIWSSAVTSTKNAWNGIGLFFNNLWISIKTTTENIWNGIKAFFINIWNSIVNEVVGIVTGFVNIITGTFHKQIGDLDVIFASMRIIFENIWDVIKNIILGALLLIIDLVTLNFTKMKEDVGHIFENLSDLLVNIWENIKNIFKYALKIIDATLTQAWNAIKTEAGIAWNAIKTLFENLWIDIKTTASIAWNDFKKWIIDFWNQIIQGAKDIWNSLINWFKELPQKLYDLAVSMFTKMKDGTVSTVSNVKDAIINGIKTAIDWIKALPAEALQWGEDIIKGIVNGIKNAAKAVGDAVNGIAQDIRKFLHFSVPDEGPLADFESWMPDFMGGLAKGINQNKGLVKTAINGLSKDMAIGVNSSISTNAGIIPDSKSSQNKDQSINNDGMFKGAIFNVRSDNDIKAIAKEIFNLQKTRARSSGVIPAT